MVVVTRRVGSGWLVVGLYWLSACTSAPLQPEAEVFEPQSAEEFPAAFAKGVCSAIGRCCSVQAFEFDRAACEKGVVEDLEVGLSDLLALRVDFDPEAAEACISDYAFSICPSKPSIAFDSGFNCSRIFRGRLAPGEACEQDTECRPDGERSAFCDPTAGCVLDRPEVRAGAGERCSGTCFMFEDGAEDCTAPFLQPTDESLRFCHTNEGLQCSLSGLEPSCVPLLPVGQSCVDSSAYCVDEGFCNFETALCEARRGGGTCAKVAGDICPFDLDCDVDADACVPRKKVNGERCAHDADCFSSYCNGSSICMDAYSAALCVRGLDLL